MKNKHSKSNNLKCDELKTAEYLVSPRFSQKEKILLFKLRSGTLDIKGNFKSQHKDPWCICCGRFEETQNHLLQCQEIGKRLNYLTEKQMDFVENDIFGDLEKQLKIVKIYSEIIEIREKMKTQLFRENLPLPDVGRPNAHVTDL